MLQTVSTMSLKSKQSSFRENFNLKPQKGSLSLRQDLKSKTPKTTNSTQSESKATSSRTPAVIKELQKHFENPEINVQCLDKICKGNDPQGDLTYLTGKHLTKLLKAFGLPALEETLMHH